MNARILKSICLSHRDGILDGRQSKSMCYAVSASLQGFLAFFCKIETELVEGDVGRGINHYWLRLPDGRIIDATADQFSTPSRPMPKVYIGELPEWYRECQEV